MPVALGSVGRHDQHVPKPPSKRLGAYATGVMTATSPADERREVVASWAGRQALYELALLAANHASERDIPVQLTFVTAEPRPLKAFGRSAGEAIERLLDQAGTALRTGDGR